LRFAFEVLFLLARRGRGLAFGNPVLRHLRAQAEEELFTVLHSIGNFLRLSQPIEEPEQDLF